jgi:hypothetical protein
MSAQDDLRHAGDTLRWAEESLEKSLYWYDQAVKDVKDWDDETSKSGPLAAMFYRDSANGEKLRQNLRKQELEVRQREDEVRAAQRKYHDVQARVSAEVKAEMEVRVREAEKRATEAVLRAESAARAGRALAAPTYASHSCSQSDYATPEDWRRLHQWLDTNPQMAPLRDQMTEDDLMDLMAARPWLGEERQAASAAAPRPKAAIYEAPKKDEWKEFKEEILSEVGEVAEAWKKAKREMGRFWSEMKATWKRAAGG